MVRAEVRRAMRKCDLNRTGLGEEKEWGRVVLVVFEMGMIE